MSLIVDIRRGQQLPEKGIGVWQIAFASVDFEYRLGGIDTLQRGIGHVLTWLSIDLSSD